MMKKKLITQTIEILSWERNSEKSKIFSRIAFSFLSHSLLPSPYTWSSSFRTQRMHFACSELRQQLNSTHLPKHILKVMCCCCCSIWPILEVSLSSLFTWNKLDRFKCTKLSLICILNLPPANNYMMMKRRNN